MVSEEIAEEEEAESAEAPMIKVESLSKFFGEHKVLDGISFEVPRGSITVILGGSGGGKSTLSSTLSARSSRMRGECG